MYKRQKSILINFTAVIVVTFVAVFAMINFKDWVNRSEAMRAMGHLGKIVIEYRKNQGAIPPESYVEKIVETLPGQARLGDMHYRGRWISFDSPDDAILAYTEKNYHSLLLDPGFVVLRRNGRVEWMQKQKFEKLLAKQQSPLEIQVMKD